MSEEDEITNTDDDFEEEDLGLIEESIIIGDNVDDDSESESEKTIKGSTEDDDTVKNNSDEDVEDEFIPDEELLNPSDDTVFDFSEEFIDATATDNLSLSDTIDDEDIFTTSVDNEYVLEAEEVAYTENDLITNEDDNDFKVYADEEIIPVEEEDTSYQILEDTIDETVETYTDNPSIIEIQEEIEDEDIEPEENLFSDDTSMELVEATLDDNGNLEVELDTSELPVGEHVVQVYYPGTDDLAYGMGTAYINVEELDLTDTQIFLLGFSAESTFGDSVNFSIVLQDINGNGLVGEKVVLSDGTTEIPLTIGTSEVTKEVISNYEDETETKEVEGAVNGTYTFNTTGDIQLLANYDGNNKYQSVKSEVFTCTVLKATLNISVTMPTRIDANTETQYTILVTNSNGNPVQGVTLFSLLNTSTLETFTSDENGKAIGTINLPKGTYNFEVYCNESTNYEEARSNLQQLFIGTNDKLYLDIHSYKDLEGMFSKGDIAVLGLLSDFDDNYITGKHIKLYYNVTGDSNSEDVLLTDSLISDSSLDTSKLTDADYIHSKKWFTKEFSTYQYEKGWYLKGVFEGDSDYTPVESIYTWVAPIPVTPTISVMGVNEWTSNDETTYLVALQYLEEYIQDKITLKINNGTTEEEVIVNTTNTSTNYQYKDIDGILTSDICNAQIPLVLAKGDYSIVALFEGNTRYDNVESNSLDVKIRDKCSLALTIDKTEVKIGETIQFTASIKDTTGNPIENELLTFTFGSITRTGATNQNGEWNGSFIVPDETAGTTEKCRLKHDISSDYIHCTLDPPIPVTVEKDHTLVITTTQSVEAKYLGDTVQYTLQATDTKGNKLSNININATTTIPPNNTQETITLTTNNDGECTYNYTCNNLGMYHILFSFEGNDEYNATVKEDINFTIAKHSTTISNITFNPTRVLVGGSSTVTATLLDNNSNPLVNKELSFTFTNGTVTDTLQATTDTKGIATTTYKLNNYGTYTCTVTYNGDDTYNSASETATGLQYSNLVTNVNGYTTDEEGYKTNSVTLGQSIRVKGSSIAEDNTSPSPLILTLTSPDGTTHPRTAPISSKSHSFVVSFSSSQYLTSIGKYTVELYTGATDTYAESNHYIIEFNVVSTEELNWYTSSSWEGNPFITNGTVVANESNLTYYSLLNYKQLLTKGNTFSFTYYHGGDGKNTLGLYNPTSQIWIGYSEGVLDTNNLFFNQETSYSDVTSSESTLMPIETETTIKIQYTDNNLIFTYDSRDGTEIKQSIPINDTQNLNEYYFAFMDYDAVGMHITNIEIGDENSD